jgi:hypothetical protein
VAVVVVMVVVASAAAGAATKEREKERQMGGRACLPLGDRRERERLAGWAGWLLGFHDNGWEGERERVRGGGSGWMDG